MEIKGENYSVIYNPDDGTVVCQGSFRLYGTEGYAEIESLFNKIADRKPEIITLNLKELRFLNSSGINTISKFVIRVRNLKSSQFVVLGTYKFPWQEKSLKNLSRLMPELKLELS